MTQMIVKLSEDEEVYKEMMDVAMDLCFDELLNDSNDEFCAVVVDYDFEKEVSVLKVVNTLDLCKKMFNLMIEAKECYDANMNPLIELEECESTAEEWNTHKKLNLLNFKNKVSNVCYIKCRFVSKDDKTLSSIKSILNSCKSIKMLNLCFDYVWNEDKMVEMWQTMYRMEKNNLWGITKKIPREKYPREEIPREKTPREEIPREEIPREKTLSKKEKEKLKKQKAKEANKLREQEKKDKAKLAEKQAKQFEKQQKERERKRIKTARKKKLALLKK